MDRDAMSAGAAVQRDSRAIRSGTRSQVKVSCFACGAWYYASAAQIRQGTHHCRCGAGEMLPANMLACEELTPDLLRHHPDYVEDCVADLRSELRAVARSEGERKWGDSRSPGHCCDCGWARPAKAHEDFWHCPKCQTINDHGAGFKASPFSTEGEVARGLAAMPF